MTVLILNTCTQQHRKMSNKDDGSSRVLPGVKHVVLVLSGKGGVGKSTVATQLALSLVDRGLKVGVLDVDLCGPSIPKMLNLEGSDIHQSSNGWVPVYTDHTQQLGVMSIGFLLASRDDAVVWRGPKKNAMIKQFINDVNWGDIDYLIVDTPPGTSDEHISLVENIQSIKPDGAVIVTTPQGVSISDVRREITFCHKTRVPVLGLIENMSGFSCPHCKECTNVFSSGGGQQLASQVNVKYLGSIPLDPSMAMCSEGGQPFVTSYRDSGTNSCVQEIVDKIIATVDNK